MKNLGVVEVFLAIISILAFFGNAFVVFLILKKRKSLKTVHSCLLLALAVQDILTAIGLFVLPGFVQPSSAYELPEAEWLREVFCRVIWSEYIPFALAITSIYTCLMLAVDRGVAVFRPMLYGRFSVSGKAIALMVILPWFSGFGFEINTVLNVKYVAQSDGTSICKWNQIDTSVRNVCGAILTFIGLIVLPAILMILVYTKIVQRRREQAARVIPRLSNLRRQDYIAPNDIEMQSSVAQNGSQTTPSSAPDPSRRLGTSSSIKRLTRIACAASAIVIVCWLPDQFYFCLSQMGLVDLGTELHNGLIILAFLNTCLNPFLYCFFDRQYTGKFETFLCCAYHRERTHSIARRRHASQSQRT